MLMRLAALVCAIGGISACAPHWRTEALVNPKDVARALGDQADIAAAPFDPAAIPDFAAPEKLRPCCAFGVDLKPMVGKVPVPLVELENVRGPDEIGPHGYDKGELTREHNGLVYTCRGGFIDIAHVRDHIDRTLYISLQIARALPGELKLEMPEEGTLRRVLVAPLPRGLLERYGRWTVATTLAAWADNHLANWHEVVTWYGWESVKGVPERMSAFSPEDIYSNTLGIRLGAGIVLDREMRSRDEYDLAAEAWMREGLRRLGVRPLAQARAAMQAVDGMWWDSNRRVPEFELVIRRSVDLSLPVKPWIVADALPDVKELQAMCADQPPTLPLEIPQKIGEHAIADLVTVQFEFAKWTPPSRFPLPAKTGDVVTNKDFDKIMEAVRAQATEELGPAFDDPKAPKSANPPVKESK